MENNFKESLINLMPVLVGRGQLVVKEVNGAKLTGKDLAQYFQVVKHWRRFFTARLFDFMVAQRVYPLCLITPPRLAKLCDRYCLSVVL